MRKRLEPAKSVVDALGGPVHVANLLGLTRTAVHQWMQPKQDGGANGFIPAKYQRGLLEYAEQNGLPVDAEMIVRGRRVSKAK